MNLSHDTVLKMLKLIEKKNKGDDVTPELSDLLDHPDYKIQFEFFNNHHANIGFTKEEFVYFFNNIHSIKISDIKSKALAMRIEDFKYIVDNTSTYRAAYENVEAITEEDIKSAESWTKSGLHKDISFDSVQHIIAIGVGVTGGFNRKGHCFYDLKKVCADRTKQGLLQTVAHELYHEGFRRLIINTTDISDMMPSEYLLYLIGREGLAVKFCQNFEGKLTQKIRPQDEMTVVKDSYDYYINNYESIVEQFRKDVNYLETCPNSSKENVEDLFEENYLYRDVTINNQRHKFYLLNPITYYFGADLWGLIYDRYGIEETMNIIQTPNRMCHVINEVLEIIDAR